MEQLSRIICVGPVQSQESSRHGKGDVMMEAEVEVMCFGGGGRAGSPGMLAAFGRWKDQNEDRPRGLQGPSAARRRAICVVRQAWPNADLSSGAVRTCPR